MDVRTKDVLHNDSLLTRQVQPTKLSIRLQGGSTIVKVWGIGDRRDCVNVPLAIAGGIAHLRHEYWHRFSSLSPLGCSSGLVS